MRVPGLTDLFKALVIVRSAAHSIKILRNYRMVGLRQSKPIQINRPVIARGRSHPESHLGSIRSKLLHRGKVSHYDVGSGNEIRIILRISAMRWENGGLDSAIDDGANFDGIGRYRD